MLSLAGATVCRATFTCAGCWPGSIGKRDPGLSTAETAMHPGLATRFDYDAVFGTVVNRMVIQAVLGHPLTVYGTGPKARSFSSGFKPFKNGDGL